ncbi:lipopolysaccharide transport periplasmic protein LptA [Hydrogenovibrio sp. SC-1]|uniref:lipopolysaccharide transport periplasmic protein LptA n=1 Tax=Hydrogenovibrio sp. SC-1 TaxID=2065820 RepID=UPI000C7BD463|nr:lipopolysaccharide transport periplasmic protein LptA [Hydrogenovibrio sp. SC-1]PLA73713.1 lipopolysaccharide transport periplasmic protein LptA [Hydrogenovibrio sp. SC-1]
MTNLSSQHFITFLVISFLLSAILTKGYADTNQTTETELPIEIKADSLLAQDNIGESTYQGNVIITQGLTEIKGETVTILHPERQVNQAIIIGNPATFKKFNEDDQTWVNGQADQITYYTVDKIVILEGDAHINQADKNSISGPKITYNLTDKTLSAKGTKTDKKRITVTFQPESESDTPSTPPQPDPQKAP